LTRAFETGHGKRHQLALGCLRALALVELRAPARDAREQLDGLEIVAPARRIVEPYVRG